MILKKHSYRITFDTNDNFIIFLNNLGFYPFNNKCTLFLLGQILVEKNNLFTILEVCKDSSTKLLDKVLSNIQMYLYYRNKKISFCLEPVVINEGITTFDDFANLYPKVAQFLLKHSIAECNIEFSFQTSPKIKKELKEIEKNWHNN
jgi:hypothetical protein